MSTSQLDTHLQNINKTGTVYTRQRGGGFAQCLYLGYPNSPIPIKKSVKKEHLIATSQYSGSDKTYLDLHRKLSDSFARFAANEDLLRRFL
jgi:hypothetical protein